MTLEYLLQLVKVSVTCHKEIPFRIGEALHNNNM